MFNYDEDDDDVFNDEEDEVTDSSTQTSSPRSRRSRSSNVPSYMVEALTRFMKENPDAISSMFNTDNGVEFPRALRHYHFLLKTMNTVIGSGNRNPLDRAVATILDDMTEGAVTRLTRVYEMERVVQNIHFVVSSLSSVLAKIKVDDRERTEAVTIVMIQLESLHDIQQFSLQAAIEDYKNLCELAGKEPDPSIISFGSVTFADLPYIYNQYFPKIENHFSRGYVADAVQTGTHHFDFLVNTVIEMIFRDVSVTDDATGEINENLEAS
jgi:hypothetical protein